MATNEELERLIKSLQEKQTELENRLSELPNPTKKPTPAFFRNALAQATDLRDIGDVKTFLDFEIPTLTPGAPPADVLRFCAAAGISAARLAMRDEGGTITYPFASISGERAFIIGSENVTVSSGTKQGTVTVTHSQNWASFGQVFLTIQNIDNIANGERPVSSQARTVGANSFIINVDTGATVAADRTVSVGYLCVGII